MNWKGKPLLLLHLYVIFSLFIAFAVQIAIWQSFSLPTWITSYLKDFLVIPIVAFIALKVVWKIKKDKTIRLNLFILFSLASFYAWYFEYHLPRRNSFYTADVYDVVCYFLGAIVFYFLQKVENKQFGIAAR